MSVDLQPNPDGVSPPTSSPEVSEGKVVRVVLRWVRSRHCRTFYRMVFLCFSVGSRMSAHILHITTVYADASYDPGSNIATWAAVVQSPFGGGNFRGMAESWVTDSTTAEMFALCKGVELALNLSTEELKEIHIHTDCQAVAQCFEHPSYKRAGETTERLCAMRDVILESLGKVALVVIESDSRGKEAVATLGWCDEKAYNLMCQVRDVRRSSYYRPVTEGATQCEPESTNGKTTL